MFLAIFLTIFALIHYLFYVRFASKIEYLLPYKNYTKLFVSVNFIGILCYIGGRYYVEIPLWLYFLFSLSIGVAFAMFLILIAHEIVNFIAQKSFYKSSRREFFKKSIDSAMLAFGGGFISNGMYNGAKEPTINKIKLNQKLLSKEYRVVQISDMHIGGLIDREFVKSSVSLINSLKPDIVAITGDIVDTKLSNVKSAIEELKEIKSRYGVYYVVGNHEYFHGVDEIASYISSLGIKVLQNESVNIGEITIVGVTDLIGKRVGVYEPDIKKATKDIKGATLFLAHQPKQLEFMEGFRPNLMLSGHTHGGQIAPFNFLVRFVQPYVKGLHKFDENSYIYVNSGIGFWGPPMRIATNAEIACIDWS